MNEESLVVLKKFDNLHEINIVKSFLATRGIETIIFDEHTANLYATPAAFFGIRLMVQKKLKEKAIQALKEQEQFLFEVPMDIEGPPCPKCNESKTEIQNLERRDLFWFIASLFFMVPMTRVSTENWICHSCNHQWSHKNDNGSFWLLFIIIRIVILAVIGFWIHSLYESHFA